MPVLMPGDVRTMTRFPCPCRSTQFTVERRVEHAEVDSLMTVEETLRCQACRLYRWVDYVWRQDGESEDDIQSIRTESQMAYDGSLLAEINGYPPLQSLGIISSGALRIPNNAEPRDVIRQDRHGRLSWDLPSRPQPSTPCACGSEAYQHHMEPALGRVGHMWVCVACGVVAEAWTENVPVSANANAQGSGSYTPTEAGAVAPQPRCEHCGSTSLRSEQTRQQYDMTSVEDTTQRVQSFVSTLLMCNDCGRLQYQGSSIRNVFDEPSGAEFDERYRGDYWRQSSSARSRKSTVPDPPEHRERTVVLGKKLE